MTTMPKITKSLLYAAGNNPEVAVFSGIFLPTLFSYLLTILNKIKLFYVCSQQTVIEAFGLFSKAIAATHESRQIYSREEIYLLTGGSLLAHVKKFAYSREQFGRRKRAVADSACSPHCNGLLATSADRLQSNIIV